MGKIQPLTSPDSNHQPQIIWRVLYAPVCVAQHGFSIWVIVFKDVSTLYKFIIYVNLARLPSITHFHYSAM